MSNLGYMRGINGSLAHHLRYAHRHFYCPLSAQHEALHQLSALLVHEEPDLCCFVEIDQNTLEPTPYNPIHSLINTHYPYVDIENKYGLQSRLRTAPLLRTKSNGFLSKHRLPFEKLYFMHGTKRLVYRITLEKDVTLFFAHLSLKQYVRAQQLLEIKEWIAQTPGQIIFMGDFNIFTGFGELAPLLHNSTLRVLNREDKPTFRFHRIRKVLDLCICSESLASSIHLKILPQPYSDHDALLVTFHLIH